MTQVLLALVGLLLLVAGAEGLVRGASRLAGMMRIPPVVIGLTIVAFGTSAPELAVNIKAGIAGQADIAVGNVVGSNIFNILFILGLSAVVTPLAVTQRLVRFDVPVMIAVSGLAWLFARNCAVSRVESLIMLLLLALYVFALGAFSREKHERVTDNNEPKVKERFSPRMTAFSVFGILLGLLLLLIGARWFVDGAVSIARFWGVSELSIGLTLVAAGTSLPEAATSVVASMRGERDIAVGNVVGSNIFNILGVLAVAGLVSPGGLSLSENAVFFDMPIMLAVSVVCLPVFLTHAAISRNEGVFFLFYYLAYSVLIVLRATDSPMLPMANTVLAYLVLPATGAFLLASVGRAYMEVKSYANAMAGDLSYAALYATKNARKIFVLVAGVTLLIIGVAMMVLPGPATIVIPLALALLGTEFVWARRILKYLLDETKSAVNRLTGNVGADNE
ncbi:MAG TPA: calcium/sodium antiporter [Candidatus Hydrogenedentes bacterium]|nr:calcium/sodium antiporter [Candidatus Hydrogenedentota bacterium]